MNTTRLSIIALSHLDEVFNELIHDEISEERQLSLTRIRYVMELLHSSESGERIADERMEALWNSSEKAVARTMDRMK